MVRTLYWTRWTLYWTRTQFKPVWTEMNIIGTDHWPGWWLRWPRRRCWGLGGAGSASVWPVSTILDEGFCLVLTHVHLLWPLAHYQRKEPPLFQLGVKQTQTLKEILKPFIHSLWPGRCGSARTRWSPSENLVFKGGSKEGVFFWKKRPGWAKWLRGTTGGILPPLECGILFFIF